MKKGDLGVLAGSRAEAFSKYEFSIPHPWFMALRALNPFFASFPPLGMGTPGKSLLNFEKALKQDNEATMDWNK